MDGPSRVGVALLAGALLTVGSTAQPRRTAAQAPPLEAATPGCLPVSGTNQQPPGLPQDGGQMERARQVKARHESALLQIPGVIGTGVGRAPDTGVPVIHVYVSQITEEVLQAVPGYLEGIQVQIVETGEFRPR